MQKNNTSGLRKKIIVGGLVLITSLMGVFGSGCESNQARIRREWSEFYNSLSPEQKQIQDEGCRKIAENHYELQRRQSEEYQIAAEQLSRYNARMQAQANQNNNKEDRKGKIMDDVTGRVGGRIAIEGLSKFSADYKRP